MQIYGYLSAFNPLRLDLVRAFERTNIIKDTHVAM